MIGLPNDDSMPPAKQSRIDNHDSLCSRISITYYKGCKTIGKGHSPLFVNQFYPDYDETAHEWEERDVTVDFCISTENFSTFVRVKEREDELDVEGAKILLEPMLAKFPKGTFPFIFYTYTIVK